MAKFYYGLDINKGLSQLESSRQSIANLGLNSDDLSVISGIFEANVTKEDLKNISNLDIDFSAEMVKLYYSTLAYNNLVETTKTIDEPIPGELNINSQISAAAIKYKYFNFGTNEIDFADVSTSRASAWSSFEADITQTSPIYYGGKLVLTPNVNNNSILDLDSISKTSELKARRFPSQLPTHTVSLNVNGQDLKFYAMRGIPVTFDVFYKNGTYRMGITRPSGYPNPSFVRRNLDDNREKVQALGLRTNIQDFDTVSRPRVLEFYYNPSNINEFQLSNLNMSRFTDTIMETLIYLDVRNNNFSEIPNFKRVAPTLQTLLLSGNNLARSSNTANYQLNNFLNKTTLQHLEINGCFSDSEQINLSTFTSLKTLSHIAGYAVGLSRIMTSTGATHKVNSASIENYTVRGHRYTSLDPSVTTASNLKYIDITNNRLDGTFNLASSQLVTFISASTNRHNVVNVSGKTNLVEYTYTNSRGTIPTDSTIVGKFTGCVNLQRINLNNCKATGSIETAFANLPSLTYLDLRLTSTTGRITNSSFFRTTKLDSLFISNGNYSNSSSFFTSSSLLNLIELNRLYVYDNIRIVGSFPDISRCRKLSIIYVQNTGLSGTIPNFQNQSQLSSVTMRNSLFSGNMPRIRNNTVKDIIVDSNRITSSNSSPFPYFECPSLENLIAFKNLLAGPIPSFAGCAALKVIDLSNNGFTSYNFGSISTNKFLTNIDISNNNLDKNSINSFIIDLLENWKLNNRAGVSVNILGNQYTTASITSNEAANNALNFLISQRWSIIY